jgi:hypothetical protein
VEGTTVGLSEGEIEGIAEVGSHEG